MPEEKGDKGKQDTSGQGNNGAGGAGQTGQAAATWETFLQQQPENVKTLFDVHVTGLKSALQSERDQHKDLAKQLREATEKLEKGSDARKELEALGGRLEIAEQRAAFYEDAAKPEIGCVNAKLAWLAAQEIEAFDRRGNVNWESLKKAFPELFRTGGSGNAGSGTGGTGTPGGSGMNEMIRRAAGK